MKRIFLMSAILMSIMLNAQNKRIVFGTNSSIVINNGANLVIDNTNANAITNVANGNIITEAENNIVRWNVSDAIGTYIVPFTTGGGVQIPLSVDITTAGTVGGNIDFSTFPVADNNTVYPTGVTNLAGCSADNGLQMIDRFWIMDASAYATNPSVTLDITYEDDANAIGGTNTIDEANLKAIRYNPNNNTWDLPNKIYGLANVAGNVVEDGIVAPADYYRVWTLVDSQYVMPPEFNVGILTDPTTCGGTDGSIQLTDLLPNRTFDVTYTNGSGVQGPTALVSDATGVIVINNLAADSYTDITLNLNGCDSIIPGPFVLNSPPSPTFAIGTLTDPTTCSGTDGSIELTGLNASTTYNVTYTDGVGVQGPTALTTDASGNLLISNLGADSYSNITIELNNCSTVDAGPYVLNDPAAPVFAIGTLTDPTTCSGTDGSIELTGLNASTTYNVTYTDGVGVQGPTALTTDASGNLLISNLGADSYSNITIELNNCSTVDAGPYVLNDPAAPVFAIGTLTDPTTCSGTDGSIELTGLNASTTYNVTYTDGVGVQGPTALTTDASGNLLISNLGADSYSNITIELNNCSTVDAGPYVLNDPAAPVFAIGTLTDPTTCSGTDGSIELTGLNASTTYNVTYTDGVGVQGPTALTTDASGNLLISNLGADSYSNITIELNNCSTVDAGPYVLNDPAAPVFAIGTLTDPTTCSGTDGSIELTGLNASTTYNVTYTDGVGVQGPTALTTDASGNLLISNLGADSYSNITIELNNCSTVDAGPYVLNDPAAPVFAIGTLTDPTTCSGTDGSIELTGLNASTTYNVTYTDGVGVQGPTALTTDASGNLLISNLGADGYSNITIELNNCTTVEAGPITLSDPNAPTFAVGTLTDPTTCGGTDGSIELTGLDAATTYNVTYTDGVGVQGPTALTTDASGNLLISNLGADGYTNITIELNNCTTIEAGPIALSDPNAPTFVVGTLTDPTTCGGTDGSIQLTGLDAATTYNVTYTDGVGVQGPTALTTDASGNLLISNLGADGYTNITIELNNCTTIEAGPIALSDPNAPTFVVGTLTDPTTCGGTDGSIQLTGLDAATTYNVTYTDGVGIQGPTALTTDASGNLLISNLGADGYTNITIELNNCTTIEAGPITLSDPNAPTFVVGTLTDPTTCGGADGSIQLTGLDAATTYNVTYTDGSGVQGPTALTTDASGNLLISNLGADGYTNITIELNNCTTIEAGPITLSDPNAPTFVVGTLTDPTTCGGTDGSIELTGLDASTTYNVTYTDGSGVQGPTALTTDASGNLLISNLGADSYSNITIELNNCTTIEAGPIALSDPNAPTFVVGTLTDPTTCGGTDGSIQLTGLDASTTYNVTYTDGSGVQGPTALTSDASGNLVIPNLGADSYSNITIELNNCTTIEAGPITLSDPNAPTFAVGTLTDPTTCSGTDGSIELTGLDASTTYNVTYTDGSGVQGPTALISDASGNLVIPNLGADSYSNITIELNNCTTVEAGPITLSDPNAPTFAVGTLTDPTTCSGTDGSIELTGLDASTTYNVTYTDGSGVQGPTALISDASGNLVIPNLGADSYSNITIELNNCTTVEAGPITLSDPNAPTFAVGTLTDPTTCSGTDGSIELTGLDASTTYNVTYTDGSGVQGPTALTSDASGNLVIPNLGGDSYSNITIELNNCTTIEAGPYVLNNPVAPVFAIGTLSDPTICGGTDGSIELTGLDASTTYNVTYTDGSGVQGPTALTTDASGNLVIPNLGGDSYSNITIELNNCSTVDAGPYVLNNPTAPEITIDVSTYDLCEEGTVMLTASGSDNYTWVNNVTSETSTDNPYSIFIDETTIFTVSGELNGCVSGNSVTVTVSLQPIIALSATNASCGMNNGSAYVSITGSEDNSILWSNSETTDVIENLSAGNYGVTVTSGACSASEAFLIEQIGNLEVEILTDETTICENTSITLTGNNADNFVWQAVPDVGINNSTDGTISVQLTQNTLFYLQGEVNGCIGDTSLQIEVVPQPSISATPPEICTGDSTLLVVAADGVVEWLNLPSGYNTQGISQTVSPSETTVYTVQVSGGVCPDTEEDITVVVNQLPEVDLSAMEYTIYAGNSTELIASGASLYDWQPNIMENTTDAIVEVSPASTQLYTVVGTDSKGCVSSDTLTITVIDGNLLYVPNVFSPNNDGVNDVLYVRGKGIRNLEFVVYNRWGEKVFSTNNLSTGWDGTFNGEKLNSAVFAYYINVKYWDGKVVSQHGSVTLVR